MDCFTEEKNEYLDMINRVPEGTSQDDMLAETVTNVVAEEVATRYASELEKSPIPLNRAVPKVLDLIDTYHDVRDLVISSPGSIQAREAGAAFYPPRSFLPDQLFENYKPLNGE